MAAPTAQDWNAAGWLSYLDDALTEESQPDLARQAFERFLQQFPTSSTHWIQYIEFELKQKNYPKVQALFTRCLRQVLDVDLWRLYLDYIRRVNSESAGVPALLAQKTISEAFEFVLQHVGLDPESTGIWQDYLAFIKTWAANNPLEESLRMDTLRRTYHRAIAIPIHNVESIWRDFDAYENGLNKFTAKKLIAEKSPAYMTARSAYRDLKAIRDQFHGSAKALATPPEWTDAEQERLSVWKKILAWEKSNPLHYEDKNEVTTRVMFAYKQALLTLRHYPEIWCDVLRYMEAEERTAETDQFLQEALQALPNSVLLNFFVAEVYESRKVFEAARVRFEHLAAYLQSQIDLIKPELDEIEAKANANKKPSVPVATAITNGDDAEENEGGAAAGDAADLEASAEGPMANAVAALPTTEHISFQHEMLQRKYTKLAEQLNIAWIQFMKFARRAEGQKEARQVFSRARRSTSCSYHVFVASALMEYHCNKDKAVSLKIFEVGLRSYGDNLQYVKEYLNHLIKVNEDSNARSLIEKTLSTISQDKAKSIWDQFLEFENDFGDLASVQKIEKRREQSFPEEPLTMARIGKRYGYKDLQVILREELGQTPPAPGSTDTVVLLPTESGHIARSQPQFIAKEVVLLPASKEEEESFPPRKSALQSHHKRKYPRPDLAFFSVYVPDPAVVAERMKERAEAAKLAHEKQQGQPSAVGKVRGHSPAPSAGSSSMMGGPSIKQQVQMIAQQVLAQSKQGGSGQTSTVQVPVSQPAVPMYPPAPPPNFPVPPALQQFLHHLPPPEQFKGPQYNVNQIFDILYTTPVPPPGPQHPPPPMHGPPPMDYHHPHGHPPPHGPPMYPPPGAPYLPYDYYGGPPPPLPQGPPPPRDKRRDGPDRGRPAKRHRN